VLSSKRVTSDKLPVNRGNDSRCIYKISIMIYSVTITTRRLFRLGKARQLVRLPEFVIGRWVIVLFLYYVEYAGAQNYFRTEAGVPYIPVLSESPTPTSIGALYFNSVDNKLYWYTGNQWMTATTLVLVPLTAPDGTLVVNITSPSGRVWMDRNLGAIRAATNTADAAAYGYCYQWCRAADGHQLTTSAIYEGPVSSAVSNASNPWYGKFVTSSNSSPSWVNPVLSDGSLWWNGTTAGANNPCPVGYHVPTQGEWQTEKDAGLTSSNAYARLKMAYGYIRYYDGVFDENSLFQYYLSSSISFAYSPIFGLAGSGINLGLPVRCIKNE